MPSASIDDWAASRCGLDQMELEVRGNRATSNGSCRKGRRMMSRISHRSVVGPRENLEDAYLASTICASGAGDVAILSVCDGVGGEVYGELASSFAVAQIQVHVTTYLTATLGPNGTCQPVTDEVSRAISGALIAANDAIAICANQAPELSGMATTAVCAVAFSDALIVGWAGDSRCYRYSAGKLQRITNDHCTAVVSSAIDQSGPEETPDRSNERILTRYLGQGPKFTPDGLTTQIASRDIVLLCTDGLTDSLSDSDIRHWLDACRQGQINFEVLPQHLVNAAIRNGTADNTTVVCYEHGSTSACTPTWKHRTLIDGYVPSLARSLHAQSQKEKGYEHRIHK